MMLLRHKSMVFLLCCAMSLTACNVVLSSDKGAVVANQMLKCLKLPASAPAKFEMAAQVTLQDGKTSFISVNFKTPPTTWEQAAAPAIADAISTCEPYGDISGKLSFSITPELIDSHPQK